MCWYKSVKGTMMMFDYGDSLIESLQEEISIRDGERETTDRYHFYQKLPDFIGSLKDKRVLSNPNDQKSQEDRHAAEDEAFVCFTTYAGKYGVSSNLGRPFGFSVSEKVWNDKTSSFGGHRKATFNMVWDKIAYTMMTNGGKKQKPKKRKLASHEGELEDLEVFAVGQLSNGEYIISVGQGGNNI